MKVIIIGGRGTPTLIAEQMTEAHDDFGMDIEVLGLALDDRSGGDAVNGYPILCGIRELHEKYGHFQDVYYVYALYRSDVLQERIQLLKDLNIPIEKFCNFVYPTVHLSKSAALGYGNMVLDGSHFSSNAKIGNFNTLHSAYIGHDSVVGNYNYFGGQAMIGSCCTIGDANFFGIRSVVPSSVDVGNNNYIGAMCCVTRKLRDNRLLYHQGTKKSPMKVTELKEDMFPNFRSALSQKKSFT